MTSKRAYALATIPPLAAAALATAALLVVDLPPRLAVHWGPGGGVDRVGGIGDLIAPMLIGVVLITATLVGTLFAKTRGATTTGFVRALVGTSVLIGAGLSFSMLATGLAQHGVDDPMSVPLSAALGGMGLGFVAALVIAVICVLLVPRVDSEGEREGVVEALALGATERASWSRPVVASPVAIGIIAAAAVMTCGVVLLAGAPAPVLLVPAVLYGLVLSTLAWRVRVDASGLVARSVLGLPVFRVPLTVVAGVRTVEVSPMRDFGGWGLRFGALGWGLVMRGGSAIAVDRKGRSPFVVTVDDADTGAALLAALAQRARGE